MSERTSERMREKRGREEEKKGKMRERERASENVLVTQRLFFPNPNLMNNLRKK